MLKLVSPERAKSEKVGYKVLLAKSYPDPHVGRPGKRGGSRRRNYGLFPPVVPHGALRVQTVQNVTTKLNKLPPKLLRALTESGIEMHPAEKLQDIRPDLVDLKPRGWTSGNTFKSSEGFFDGNRGHVVLLEKFIHPYGDPNKLVPVSRDFFGHEVMHALDSVIGISANPLVRAAYDTDIVYLQGDKKRLLEYHLQPKEEYIGTWQRGHSARAGLIETVADIGADLFFKTSLAWADIHEAFPQTYKAIQDLLEKEKYLPKIPRKRSAKKEEGPMKGFLSPTPNGILVKLAIYDDGIVGDASFEVLEGLAIPGYTYGELIRAMNEKGYIELED